MKIKVVGWTEYDSYEFKEGKNTWAVRMALVDEIKNNGYLFSGYDHQERSNCAPVFNDGKMRRFTQRGFGDIMAEAHGNNNPTGYAMYMFGLEPSVCSFPKNEIFKDDFQVEKNLNESFILEVDECFLKNALNVKRITTNNISHIEKTIKIEDLPELRYIDKGDTLIFKSNGKSSAFSILDVTRDRDITFKERIKYTSIMNYSNNKSEYESTRKEFMALPIVLTLKVKQKRKLNQNN